MLHLIIYTLLISAKIESYYNTAYCCGTVATECNNSLTFPCC